MNRGGIISIGAIGLIMIVMAIILFSDNDAQKSYSWSENYKQNSKQPYGLSICSDLLSKLDPDGKVEVLKSPLSKRLKVLEDSLANYVLVSEKFFLDSLSQVALLEFVERGNTAFISSKSFPNDLLNQIDTACYYFYQEYEMPTRQRKTIKVRFTSNNDKSFGFYLKEKNTTSVSRWQYFDSSLLCTYYSRPNKVLSAFNDTMINYLSIAYGKGRFLLHSTPISLSNYHMLFRDNLEHFNLLFSELPERDILWDEFSKLPYVPTDASGLGRSPLIFILQQVSLRWAWYLLLALSLVYVLVRSRRKQRIIPVLEPNDNSSLDLVKTLGALYFQQAKHRRLALQKYGYFVYQLRHKYGIHTDEQPDEVRLKQMALRTGADQQVLSAIFDRKREIEQAKSIDDKQLMSFHNIITKFYQQAS